LTFEGFIVVTMQMWSCGIWYHRFTDSYQHSGMLPLSSCWSVIIYTEITILRKMINNMLHVRF